MKPEMVHKALLPLTAAACLALALTAAGCTGRATDPTASGATSVAPPAPTTPATGAPAPDPTSTAATSTAPTTPRTAPGPGRCHTADLGAELRNLDAAAGQRYAAVVLTNRSTRTCGVYGYGGLQLLDATRRPLPTDQLRDRHTPPRLVLLRPGASANSQLHWSPVPDGTESQTAPCQPTPAYVLITPPDETQPITLAWSSSEVCSHGRIDQTPYVAGTRID